MLHTCSSIFTPVRVSVFCRWHKLSPEKLSQIRVLQQLKGRLEQELGQALPTGKEGQCTLAVGFEGWLLGRYDMFKASVIWWL